MSVDLKFLGSILDNGGTPSKIFEYGVQVEYLTADAQRLYDHIKGHYLKYGKAPSDATTEAEVGILPDFEYEETTQFYADKIIQRHKENVLKPGISKAIEALKTQDPDKAIETLKEFLSTCGKIGEKENGSVVDARATAEKRCKDYLAKMDNPEVYQGVPWPWPYMNRETLGMHPGELYFIIARLKQGKTWTIVSMMSEAINSNVPAMVVTLEMPVKMMLRRFDAVQSKVGYSDFTNGGMSGDERGRYTKAMKDIRNGGAPLHVVGDGRVKTVQDIELLIEELKPKVVLVDGVYLLKMAGQSKASKWERVAAVVEELKQVSLRKNVAILATSQFNRGVKKETKTAGAEDIGFAYEIAQSADILMSLIQDDEMKENKQMVIKLNERREGECFNLKINWDFTTMDFSEIGTVSDEELNMTKGRQEEPDQIF